MKKLFLIVFIFFISISSSFAAFFIDGQGNYIATGELDPVTGWAAGIGFGVTDDVNFLLRASVSETTENEGLASELKYEYSYAAAGIEYIPPIPMLEKYRIYWKNAVNIGASMFEVSFANGEDDGVGPGVYTSFHTGLQYNFTQIIAPYIDFGYHKSFYDSTKDVSIRGYQVSLGIRFYLFGSRDYEQGY
ncbi:MAG: hypothetical protein CVV49_06765 [Spirochaetae bacterium HGW-Spirochaetae-5]|nr:MAG: hypothetical protein CVV49_06765 [Spirochaetae bacterium HGW-Spirochaetae-5]